MSLTEFLLARITEDEADARNWVALGGIGEMDSLETRVLAECAAKRAIVGRHVAGAYYAYADWPDGTLACDECGDTVTVAWPCPTLLDLAAVYGDHADYDESWRP